MNITGIICEYNPLHLGHRKQLERIKADFPDGGIVCLMSGNYVQRGAPAIFDKTVRAKAAVTCGADLVLELPVTVSLSSAEGFAQGGVNILSPFCNRLCFGAETPDAAALLSTAEALFSDGFREALRRELDLGRSFPAARQAALEKIGMDARCICRPNDILAVEYCKAIQKSGSNMQPYPIARTGSYHDTCADPYEPSATAVRQLILSGESWKAFVPEDAYACFEGAAVHTATVGERAILTRLRTMTEAEFEALPYGSEGLWRKLMHAARSESTLEGVIASTKSKRYTRTRIDRMILCAFLGITLEMMNTPAPYTRVLAFNDKGRQILKNAKQTGDFLNIGEKSASSYQELESRCGSLYGLFAADIPGAPGAEAAARVQYIPG